MWWRWEGGNASTQLRCSRSDAFRLHILQNTIASLEDFNVSSQGATRYLTKHKVVLFLLNTFLFLLNPNFLLSAGGRSLAGPFRRRPRGAFPDAQRSEPNKFHFLWVAVLRCRVQAVSFRAERLFFDTSAFSSIRSPASLLMSHLNVSKSRWGVLIECSYGMHNAFLFLARTWPSLYCWERWKTVPPGTIPALRAATTVPIGRLMYLSSTSHHVTLVGKQLCSSSKSVKKIIFLW